MSSLLIIILLSYLAGSIPTSIIFSKIFFGYDIRDRGSGNAGGTNAFRVMGWKTGLTVTVIDVAKGVVATLLISQIRMGDLSWDHVYLQMIAGTSAVAGHVWTIFAGFRGGKGVGTASGMLFVLYPVAALICLAVFFIVLAFSRYVSLSSMSAAITLPLTLIMLNVLFNMTLSPPLLILAVLLALLIVYTHRGNIQRLMHGTENRIGKIF
ncbi:MAG: glycerol-3-phosphate 1-O-acyltransferase PlsY [bacterium]